MSKIEKAKSAGCGLLCGALETTPSSLFVSRGWLVLLDHQVGSCCQLGCFLLLFPLAPPDGETDEHDADESGEGLGDRVMDRQQLTNGE